MPGTRSNRTPAAPGPVGVGVVRTLFALALVTCGAPRYTLVCPARGGPPWRQVTTAHFSVTTARDAAGARRLAEDLEMARAAILSTWFGGSVDPPARLRVVALDEAGLRELAPDELRGWFGPDLFGDAVAVVPAQTRGAVAGVVLHEVAHQLAASVFARQPRWFAEGFATYLETLAIEGDTVWIGRANDARAREAGASRRASVKDLFGWNVGPGRPGYYGRAWLLVHYLVDERGPAFSRYQKRLARAEDPAAAWAAELPEYDPLRPGAHERLDRELDVYLRRGQYWTVRLPLERPSVALSERTLTASEVHAVRLALPSMRPGAGAEERAAEVDEALREDPGQPVALLRRSRGLLQPERAALAREATRTHPLSWQAWAFLAAATSPGERCVRQAALRRAAALAPENPRLLNELAWSLIQGGHASEAMRHAEEAARLEPWSAAVLDTYAAAAAETGRCADAVRAAERALELAGDDTTGAARDALALRLAHYREGCGEAGSAVPAGCPDDEAERDPRTDAP